MYNEVQKEKFIATIKLDSSAEIARKLFTVSEEYEATDGKDLSDFSVEDTWNIIVKNFDIKNSVGNIDTRSSPKAKAVNAANRYRRWVHGRSVEQINYAGALRRERVRKTMVRSPSELQEVLDGAFRPVEDGTVDNVYRGFLWLIYSGVPKKDTVDITRDEVSIQEMKIRHDGKVYPIYEEEVPALEFLIGSSKIKTISEKYSVDRNRVGENLLLSSTRNAKMTPLSLTMRSRDIIRDAYKGSEREDIIPLNKLRMSGVFYRAYERERAVDVLGMDPSNGCVVLLQEEAVYQATVVTKARKEDDEANPHHISKRIDVAGRELAKNYALWLEYGGGRFR